MTGKNDTSPAVSVVMSFSNEPLQWLKLAVESILSQTFRDFEFIIVCDNPGFSEGIAYIEEVAKGDSRVISIVNENNIGPTKSFNTAISIARGRYIARMDADDISVPERFERQVRYLDTHQQVSVCATDVHIIDGKGKIIRRRKFRNKMNHDEMLLYNTVSHPSVMFRKSLTDMRNPIYNEDFIYSQDYELWTFLLLNGCRIHTLEDTLLLYRKSRIQISSAKKAKQTELFKKAHKEFITTWMVSKGFIEKKDSEDMKLMLQKCSSAFRQCEDDDRMWLTLIIYVLYLSISTDEWVYRFKYLADTNLIAFRIKFILTFRLFFSRKTRRNRSGFIPEADQKQ